MCCRVITISCGSGVIWRHGNLDCVQAVKRTLGTYQFDHSTCTSVEEERPSSRDLYALPSASSWEMTRIVNLRVVDVVVVDVVVVVNVVSN